MLKVWVRILMVKGGDSDVMGGPISDWVPKKFAYFQRVL